MLSITARDWDAFASSMARVTCAGVVCDVRLTRRPVARGSQSGAGRPENATTK